MHDLRRLVRQLVCLDDTFQHGTSVIGLVGGRESLTVPADHLDDKSAFCLVWLILNMAFAALNRCVFVPYIANAAFENRKKGLQSVSVSENSKACMAVDTLLYS